MTCKTSRICGGVGAEGVEGAEGVNISYLRRVGAWEVDLAERIEVVEVLEGVECISGEGSRE